MLCIDSINFGFFDKRGYDFEHQVLLIFNAISSALDNADFVIQTLHETEGYFVIGMAVTDDPIPVSLDHGRKFFEGVKPLPTQL